MLLFNSATEELEPQHFAMERRQTWTGPSVTEIAVGNAVTTCQNDHASLQKHGSMAVSRLPSRVWQALPTDVPSRGGHYNLPDLIQVFVAIKTSKQQEAVVLERDEGSTAQR